MDRVANGDFMHLSNPKFWDYIEDGVKELVANLINQGFVPISSCEGHNDVSDHKEPYVRIGFKKGQFEQKLKLCEFLIKAQEEKIRFNVFFFNPPATVEGKERYDDFSILIKFAGSDGKINVQKFAQILAQ